jgi:predicted metal-dependent enzyme (double-stranded beta helix superfamily)
MLEQPVPSSAAPERRGLAAARRELSRWRARLCFDDLETLGVYPRDAQRSYLRLPSRGGCEVWLIVWPPGSRAALHDHGEASAVASVLCAELRESLALGAGPFSQRTWQAGAVLEIPRGARHEVWNAGEQTAYSLHVYTPKLASMTFYERTPSGALTPLRSERAEDWR